MLRYVRLPDVQVEADARNEHCPDRQWATLLQGRLTRKVVKQTVMTSVYGVTAVGARAQIESKLVDLDLEWPEPIERSQRAAALCVE